MSTHILINPPPKSNTIKRIGFRSSLSSSSGYFACTAIWVCPFVWLKIIRPLRVAARTPRMASHRGKHRLSNAPTAPSSSKPRQLTMPSWSAPAPTPPHPPPPPSVPVAVCPVWMGDFLPWSKDLRESRPCDKITGYKIFVDIPR